MWLSDLQQVVPSSVITSTSCEQDDDNKLVATCYEQSVLVLFEQLVTSLLPSQPCNKMITFCSCNWIQEVRTHPDISSTTHLLQVVRNDFGTSYVCAAEKYCI